MKDARNSFVEVLNEYVPINCLVAVEAAAAGKRRILFITDDANEFRLQVEYLKTRTVWPIEFWHYADSGYWQSKIM